MRVAVGVRDQREVVAEHAVARLDVDVVADACRSTRPCRSSCRTAAPASAPSVGVAVGRRRQPVRLLFLAPLVVADQLVVLVHLIGRLARGVPQLGVEQRAGDRADEIRLADRRLLVAVREVPPDLVLLDRAADVDVEVAVLLRLVAVQADAAGVGRAEEELRRQVASRCSRRSSSCSRSPGRSRPGTCCRPTCRASGSARPGSASRRPAPIVPRNTSSNEP